MRSFAYIWASLDPNATMPELVFCISFRGLGARLGSGGRGAIFMMDKKVAPRRRSWMINK